MATFAEIKYGLDDIAKQITRGREFLNNSRTSLVRAQTLLAAIPGNTSTLRADIDQAAIDNPTDDAYLLAKNEKDKLVSDFQALKTYADNLITAYDAVSE